MATRNEPRGDLVQRVVGRRQPDPAAHARALIESFGAPTALLMARMYAKDHPPGAYWPAVLAAANAYAPPARERTEDDPSPPRRPLLHSDVVRKDSRKPAA